jgi:hypothetical protein
LEMMIFKVWKFWTETKDSIIPKPKNSKGI